MYCSRCGAVTPEGTALCSHCGQTLSVAANMARVPPLSVSAAGPAYAAVPRLEYAGFWLRALAYLIDSAVIGIAFVVILIPLIFLTGLGDLLSRFHPDEDMSDFGLFLILGLVFLATTVSLVVTWLYHALLESSDWQATLGKKLLGLVVTDMAGQRVSFGRSTGRHFAKIITNMVPLFIGYFIAAFTEKKQALHDMIAGCLVLRRG